MGTWLKVVGEDDDWLQVETRRAGPPGWVKKEHIRLTPILKIFFVDVGQGDGAIIEHPDGILLIDGGPNKNMYRFMTHRYTPIFREGRQVHIDAMVMSHPDQDHFGGLTHVLKDDRFTVGTIYHNGIIRYDDEHSDVDFDLGKVRERTIHGEPVEVLAETINTLTHVHGMLEDAEDDPDLIMKSYIKFWKAAADAKGEGRLGHAKRITSRNESLPGFDTSNEDKLRIEVLGPVPTKPTGAVEYVAFGEPPLRNSDSDHHAKSSSHTRNGHSIILKLIYGDHTFLFGGDLNIPAEKHLMNHYGSENPFRVDVAKACHHGSSDFLVNYLKKVRPQVNVFSSGDNKSFDHPVADALGAAGQHSRGSHPLLFSTELARAISRGGIHFGLINARSNGRVLTMAQMKEQHRDKTDVWDSFTVPWKGKFRDS
jgi:beta-lactamase superfamily II metal-dependent hydrolase